MSKPAVLERDFFRRRPDLVAVELLGKVVLNGAEWVAGMVTEVEPYFGPEDPASRARKGGDLARTMYGEPCTALVYGVHREWLLNVVAHEDGEAGAVLIRGIVPVDPETLKPVDDPIWGPGRVTRYLRVDKRHHKAFLCRCDKELRLAVGVSVGRDCISRSPRVGVREDLPEPLNFRISCIDRFIVG
ncbi:MAG: DNA-3-methyladenine glycosylase [Candidatus Korarchaeota archaeon NZ13-K]|nr:MAG: DNA-3-methyladenine glycosylase [Candidatus Korarchaeota archaeon NZ13-K]